MDFVIVLEIIGTIAFAISGAFVAIEKKMDIFGVCILGITTAVGGGVTRDIILGIIPPTAIVDPSYIILAAIVSILVFLPVIRKHIRKDGPDLLIMDSAGLAVFVVLGVKIGMPYDNIFFSVFIGSLNGVGGGVLRDIFASNSPYIFTKHFYACAVIIGALLTSLLWPIGELWAMSIGAITIFTLRMLAAKYRWSLPKAK